ncbi:hypothetical protein H632_c5348p0, partial [Helicosporidium sp. ATCC 50920]
SEQRLYIARGELGRVRAVLSFLPAPWSAASQGFLGRVLALAELEDAHVALRGLALREKLLSPGSLEALARSHYMRLALPQILRLLGSASLLGDPFRLVQHLGLGVWALLASPAAGL